VDEEHLDLPGQVQGHAPPLLFVGGLVPSPGIRPVLVKGPPAGAASLATRLRVLCTVGRGRNAITPLPAFFDRRAVLLTSMSKLEGKFIGSSSLFFIEGPAPRRIRRFRAMFRRACPA
jgi:hypothetical protein